MYFLFFLYVKMYIFYEIKIYYYYYYSKSLGIMVCVGNIKKRKEQKV